MFLGVAVVVWAFSSMYSTRTSLSKYSDSNVTNVDNDTTSMDSTLKSKVIFDTKAFMADGKRTMTEEELIKKIGQPDKIDNWNYTSAIGNKYPIKTLTYGNYEYKFNNGLLHRITIFEPISYNSKDDFLEMFNVTKNSQSKLNDTGVAYRLTNGSIHDLWVGYNDKTKKTEWIHISYSDLFD